MDLLKTRKMRKSKRQKPKILAFSPRLGQKKGWIRIIEAMVAILFITGVLLIIVSNNNESQENAFSDEIRELELSILREIQLNSSLRQDILSQSSVPESVISKINSRTPAYLECEAVVCLPEESCDLVLANDNRNKDIYAESVIISSTLETFNPKQLKLFCWSG